MGDKPVLSVFIGQLAVSGGDHALAIHGLGSCVALVLCEPRTGMGGLAHVLLPGSRPPTDTTTDLPAKYAASALEALRSGLSGLGAKPALLRAGLVGGAKMFESEMDLETGVGARNVDSLRSILRDQGIPLAADDTGGRQGRTVIFSLPECRLRIRTLRGGWTEKDLR